MQIPSHLQIPPSRIRGALEISCASAVRGFFWKEIDEDDSGKAIRDDFKHFYSFFPHFHLNRVLYAGFLLFVELIRM